MRMIEKPLCSTELWMFAESEAGTARSGRRKKKERVSVTSTCERRINAQHDLTIYALLSAFETHQSIVPGGQTIRADEVSEDVDLSGSHLCNESPLPPQSNTELL